MMGVYNLLLGYSFENLLKGIVVAQRGSAGSVDKMDKDLKTHNMKRLYDYLKSIAWTTKMDGSKVMIDKPK